ncbi:MAG: hypothetical protein QGG24_03420, partial [Vicinamibacterales bacterium]|nr:hypothetical protein [Vicinamibacterales bacterium]
TEKGHETGLRVFWPSSVPSNDGSALGERCGGLEAEHGLAGVIDHPGIDQDPCDICPIGELRLRRL